MKGIKSYEVEDVLLLFRNSGTPAYSFKDSETLKKLIIDLVGKRNLREYEKYNCPLYLQETLNLILK